MDNSVAREAYPGLHEPKFNPRNAVNWIEQKPAPNQVSYACDLFGQLLQPASKPKQTSGHACVKLCGFVEQCSKSESSVIRRYAFAQDTAHNLLNIYVEWNEQDQHRSMRLILDFLKTSILKNIDPQVGHAIKDMILTDVVSFITLESTKPSVKSAMTALDYFLQKDVFYLNDVIATFQHVHRISEERLQSWTRFISKVFEWMEMKNICPIAGKLLATIFSGPWDESKNVRFLPDSWHSFLCAGLDADISLLEPIQLYTLIPLFTSDKEQMLKYIEYLFSIQISSEVKASLSITQMIWLSALEAGKKVGFVGEPSTGSEQSAQTDGVVRLERNVLEDLLSHSSQEARASAVSILIASPSTSKPYSRASLELLQQFLPAFHADGDAKFRIIGAIGGITKDLDRKMKKNKKNDASSSESVEIAAFRDLLSLHTSFLQWYFDFLKSELIPTASYQRHITSLKAMVYVLKSDLRSITNKTGQTLSLTDYAWLRAVLDLLMDPFDDVRETAASLLVLLSSSGADNEVFAHSQHMLQELEEFCTRAEKLASRTARADHSDGVARSYEVLCRWLSSRDDKLTIPARILADIENKLSAAESNLAEAVLQAPIHGAFAALRYVWLSLSTITYSPEELQNLESLQSHAIGCCQRIWHAVRLVLCDDSPEGHLPEELEEVDELDTKDLLSYSFRAVHESSHLLRVIASTVRSSKAGFIHPSYDEFEAIGNLTFDQLSNLRHRGAFTTVSQTFTSCCQLVKYAAASSCRDSELLNVWYEGALSCIYSQTSTTRRSAGIPALVVGILSSSAEQPSFHDVMQKLQEIAKQPASITETDGSNVPQVHATNCIKDIFKSSMLSKRAEPYLTDCLQLAANSLKSEVWAIRNCGLILLRSLIDTLFGTSESKTSMEAGWDGRTTRLAWHKYDSLPLLLVNLLKSGQTTQDVSKGMVRAESVFPALDIIRRAGPPQEFKSELYGVVAWYLGSPIWHVREIAARTLCSFLLQADWLGRIRTLLQKSYSSANKIHGALLTLKFLLERLLEAMPDKLFSYYPDVLFELLEEISQASCSFQACSEARAVYFEIIGFLNALKSKERLSSSTREVDLLELDYTPPSSTRDRKAVPSALEESKEAQACTISDMERLLFSGQPATNLNIKPLFSSDTNVACDALQTILAYTDSEKKVLFGTIGTAQILEICLTTLRNTDAPEPRTVALKILASQFDGIFKHGTRELLPSVDELRLLWTKLQSQPMNPCLADAIIRASGPVMKAISTQIQEESDRSLDQWFRPWGEMMRNAGSDDKGFDTRMAGIRAIVSFTSHGGPPNSSLANLPWLLALYDYLNDDDDEIREIATTGTIPILGKPLASIESSVRLLSWLAERFGDADEFRTHVASRMIGHVAMTPQMRSAALSGWTPAAAQLTKALQFDGSLFAVEEHNLYVDEVRETLRWKTVFDTLSYTGDNKVVTALADWTIAGLRDLVKHASGDDGVLGWTSKPAVFALCSRVVVTAVALSKKGNEEVKNELERFVDLGRQHRLHGLLLELCEAR
ncbi:hypothetical protein TruAng_007726 [Truncatella angustata]|nr:hypothetical protein TruAng_007726 [Truncatella angustata]